MLWGENHIADYGEQLNICIKAAERTGLDLHLSSDYPFFIFNIPHDPWHFDTPINYDDDPTLNQETQSPPNSDIDHHQDLIAFPAPLHPIAAGIENFNQIQHNHI